MGLSDASPSSLFSSTSYLCQSSLSRQQVSSWHRSEFHGYGLEGRATLAGSCPGRIGTGQALGSGWRAVLADWAGHGSGASWQQRGHIQVEVARVFDPWAEVFESPTNTQGGFRRSNPKILYGPSAEGLFGKHTPHLLLRPPDLFTSFPSFV